MDGGAWEAVPAADRLELAVCLSFGTFRQASTAIFLFGSGDMTPLNLEELLESAQTRVSRRFDIVG